MTRIIMCGAVGMTSLLLCLGGSAWGQSFDPGGKAKRVKLPLVTAFKPCEAPNAQMWVGASEGPNPGYAPACPAMRSDADCGFGPDGSGTLTIKQATKALHAIEGASAYYSTLDLKGLTGCDGYFLVLTLKLRVTNQGPSPTGFGCLDCTTQEFVMRVAECPIAGGRCNIRGGQGVIDGASNVEIIDCWVDRFVDVLSPVRTFSCGLVAPAHD